MAKKKSAAEKRKEKLEADIKKMEIMLEKMRVESNRRMGLSDDGKSMKYNSGGLSTKKYSNPVTFVDNLKNR
jgi:hypothetical protein